MEQSPKANLRRAVSRLPTAIACLALGLGSGFAQTAQTNALAPAPANAPAAAPVPVAEGREKIESRPGYAQQPVTSPQAAPTPQTAPAPVVTPAPPTAQVPYTALPAYGNPETSQPRDTDGSAYIPVDSWVYPAMLRLYSLGYVNTAYLAMRPYTRRSALHMLQASEGAIAAGRRFCRRC